MSDLVTLPEVQTHLDLTGHADELTLLIESATEKIEDLAGPVIGRTVTESVPLRAGYGLLSRYPVLSVETVTGSDGRTLTGWVMDDAGGIGGVTGASSSSLPTGGYGTQVTVTYTAGRVAPDAPVPAKFKRAALRFIAWSWRRDHGGSETYNPDGEGAGVMGVSGIDKELRYILGRDLLPPKVA